MVLDVIANLIGTSSVRTLPSVVSSQVTRLELRCERIEWSSASVYFAGSKAFQYHHYAGTQSTLPDIYLLSHFAHTRLLWPIRLYPLALSRFQRL